MYVCRICRKRTRETGSCESGVELCAACYDDAGIENYHNDEGHEGYYVGCAVCIEAGYTATGCSDGVKTEAA